MQKKLSNKELQKILKEYVNKQKRHTLNLYQATDRDIERIFRTYQKEIEVIFRDYISGKVNANIPFRFAEYPHLTQYFEPIRASLQASIYTYTIESINKAWGVANKDITPIVKAVYPNTPTKKLTKYLSHNEAAKNAFIERSISSGRTLKGRTWLLSKKYLREVEDTLTIGIHNGDSAERMGKRIAEYLNNPDKKIEDIAKIDSKSHKQLLEERLVKEGNTTSSNQRSVKKHAKILARNETNLAYRNAETERINRLDFIVGYEIKLSNAHPRVDICDFVNGRYPKDFKWNSWHVNCLCYRVPILKTIEELAEDNVKILQGEEPTTDSVNAVKGIPEGAKQYFKENFERFNNYKNKTYFFEDNLNIIKKLSYD